MPPRHCTPPITYQDRATRILDDLLEAQGRMHAARRAGDDVGTNRWAALYRTRWADARRLIAWGLHDQDHLF